MSSVKKAGKKEKRRFLDKIREAEHNKCEKVNGKGGTESDGTGEQARENCPRGSCKRAGKRLGNNARKGLEGCDEKESCSVRDDAVYLDGADGAFMGELFPENCKRALCNGQRRLWLGSDCGENFTDLQRRVHFLFLAERREGFYLRHLVLCIPSPFAEKVLCSY